MSSHRGRNVSMLGPWAPAELLLALALVALTAWLLSVPLGLSSDPEHRADEEPRPRWDQWYWQEPVRPDERR